MQLSWGSSRGRREEGRRGGKDRGTPASEKFPDFIATDLQLTFVLGDCCKQFCRLGPGTPPQGMTGYDLNAVR